MEKNCSSAPPSPATLSDDIKLEEVRYEYNLRNRLKRVETDYQNGTVEIAEYKYNPDGVRVSKHTWTEISGTPQNDDITVVYLIDSYNHTGYAQVLEETIDDGSTVTTKTYTIGDDVISQSSYDGSTVTTEFLLYDGHGSTRQLAYWTGSDISITDSFSYDAYGVLLQDEDNFPPTGTQTPGYTPANTLTPMQTFLGLILLVKEKMLNKNLQAEGVCLSG